MHSKQEQSISSDENTSFDLNKCYQSLQDPQYLSSALHAQGDPYAFLKTASQKGEEMTPDDYIDKVRFSVDKKNRLMPRKPPLPNALKSYLHAYEIKPKSSAIDYAVLSRNLNTTLTSQPVIKFDLKTSEQVSLRSRPLQIFTTQASQLNVPRNDPVAKLIKVKDRYLKKGYVSQYSQKSLRKTPEVAVREISSVEFALSPDHS